MDAFHLMVSLNGPWTLECTLNLVVDAEHAQAAFFMQRVSIRLASSVAANMSLSSCFVYGFGDFSA
jgi:hypothetical protein